MESILNNWRTWAWPAGTIAGAICAGLVAHWILFRALKRVTERKPSILLASFIRRAARPSLLFLPFFALVAILPAAHLPQEAVVIVQRLAGLGLIAAIGWAAMLFTGIVVDMMSARFRADVKESEASRRIHTQLQMIHRMATILIFIVTLSVMLMTFPEIKHVGISLLASAGLAGLVIGTAMKGSLSSLIAGVQIAFTQPIRLDDAVVVEGEWGWVEEIATTYVIVRTWDRRRLVLPLSYFLEHPFQNWTRGSEDLLGSVFLYVDYTVPVEEVRKELRRIVGTTNLWKGQVCVLQVTDATANAIQLRALVDASDSNAGWDLRCYVREKLIEFLQKNYPDTLPKVRTEFRPVEGGNGQPANPSLLTPGQRAH
jgi:small-conductance mechanosensitive channel